MARYQVIVPVSVVVDTGASSQMTHDAVIGVAAGWLVLPANSGLVVASVKLEGKAYESPLAPAGTANIANTQLGTAAPQNPIKEPLA